MEINYEAPGYAKLVLPSEGYSVLLGCFKTALSPKSFLRINSFLFDLPPMPNQLRRAGGGLQIGLTVFETIFFFLHHRVSGDWSLLVLV